MYPSMQQARLSVTRPCRFVARRRYPTSPSSRRQFHWSQQWLSSPSNDPHNDPSAPGNIVDNRHSAQFKDIVANNGTLPPVDQTGKPVSKPYGSAMRRAMRNKLPDSEQPNTLPMATIPRWFVEHNTVSHVPESQVEVEPQHQVEIALSKSVPGTEDTTKGESATGGDGEDPSSAGPATSKNRYAVAEILWDELRASVKAGLRLPPVQYAKEPPAKRSHLVLQYPGNDGIVFLDAVVKRLAHELQTDLITLNAQDIVQLFCEQDLAEAGQTSPLRSLSYEVYRRPLPGFSRPPAVAPIPEASEGEEGEEGEEDEEEMSEIFGAEAGAPRFITVGSGRDSALSRLFGLKSIRASINGQDEEDAMRNFGHRAEQRWTGLLNEVISSAGQSHQPVPGGTEATPGAGSANSVLSRDTIIHVQDYREIQSSREGSRVVSLLQKVIQDRRIAGSRILLIGTTSQSQELPHTSVHHKLKVLRNAFDDNSFSKTLVITPAQESKIFQKTLAEDQKNRTMDVNIRHLQSMLRYRLDETSSDVKDNIFGTRAWPLDSSTIKQSFIRERFWSYNQVHWAATLALGLAEPNEPFSFEHIRQGIELMAKSNRLSGEWLHEKLAKSTEATAGHSREDLLASLRKTCNNHEKKLLNGVVDAKSIRTTFSDVQVPPETVDALKTLTSLSLIRPEAFTYGVLATDKIPGLLLYGPPGTGKTLLAKAVARESGATVLEVSGSEVYDMYVGEGEKNVKAIFTLAKKLSPCIVFIDEADAILCSRTTGAHNRNSHRELINQFLREWDGMNDMSAFIMVATNRPFDLDDAVLRRLPRRLLVDLPTEEDRLAILKIHLKDEQLAECVDLAEIARRTPLYSGSDLKNLSVAAALACVREENAAAAQHQGEAPYQYPERRTLTRTHFERGMEEISASISEDMSSLAAIRKFDEQYGDRKGRPKSTGWGFIAPASEEPATESARVRT